MANPRQDMQKTVRFVVECKDLTKQLLAGMMNDFLRGHDKELSGEVAFKDLVKESNGNFESIDVSQTNLKDFRETAKKYDLAFSVEKTDEGDLPLYRIYFGAKDLDTLQDAFREYTDKVSSAVTISREERREMAKEARDIADRNAAKEKSLNRGEKSR